MEQVSVFCFAASYALALALELWHLARPRPIKRLGALTLTGAGLIAQTIYLAVQRPPLLWQYGLLLVLAWVLVVFYLSSALHHGRQAWGVFVLPLVLVLVVLAQVFGQPTNADGSRPTGMFFQEKAIIHIAHVSLLILGAVGVCIGFVASLMYLVQSRRLKAKTPPGKGIALPSLERLEEMNRRALGLAFPLLTGGMLLGIILMTQPVGSSASWADPRVLGSIFLWAVFAALLYFRFATHVRGRRVALLTVAAFGVMLVTLALPHMGGGRPPLPGGPP